MINLNAYIGEDWASQIPVNEFKTFTFHSAKIVEEVCENKALQELIDVIRKKQRKSKIHNKREVVFLKPEKILEKIKKSDSRKELENEVRELYKYSRKVF